MGSMPLPDHILDGNSLDAAQRPRAARMVAVRHRK
jgi:hypothetical protein